MKPKKIMVVLGAGHTDLKGVHYALAVAERMQAQVFIVKFHPSESFSDPKVSWIEDALKDVVTSARQAGRSVFYHLTSGSFEEEIVGLLNENDIDLIVIGDDEVSLKHSLLQIRSRFSSQIIQVKSKNNISYL